MDTFPSLLLNSPPLYLPQAVRPQVRATLTLCRPSMRTCTNLFHQPTIFLKSYNFKFSYKSLSSHIIVPSCCFNHWTRIRAHREQILPAATTISPLLGLVLHIIRKTIRFGTTQAQPHYVFDTTQANIIGFGPHIYPQRHYGFGANKSKPHYGFGSSYSDVNHHLPPVGCNADLLKILIEAGKTIPLKPSSSVPRQNLLQLKQNLQLAVQNSQVKMPNPDRRLLSIDDTNITYLDFILHNHQQCLILEVCAAASATATESAPN